MKPPVFRYERPDSLSAALELLAAQSLAAKVLAGGQSLVALMNLRLVYPDVLVDLGSLNELRYITHKNGVLSVGAMTTHAAVEGNAAVVDACPLLAQAAPWIGHAAIRNRGTIGGSVAHADPAAELPVVLLALNGIVTLRSVRGARTVVAEDFFTGFLSTVIEPDEILTEVAFPAASATGGYAFEEFARRPGDFGIVSVACQVEREGEAVRSARVVLGGVGGAPVVLPGLDVLDAEPEDVVAAAAEAAAAAAGRAAPDIHATTEYRVHLARQLTKRAVTRATARS